MLTLELDKTTEMRFTKMLNLKGMDCSSLINSMIDYQIKELQKGMRNIELDFSCYEQKYNLKTQDFYQRYEKGEFGDDSDTNDFMIWSGEYESYLEFENQLKQLVF